MTVLLGMLGLGASTNNYYTNIDGQEIRKLKKGTEALSDRCWWMCIGSVALIKKRCIFCIIVSDY